MSLPLLDAVLYGYQPGNNGTTPSEADYEIPPGDIDVVDISERAGPLRDSAKLKINNQGGRYTQAVDHGDRLRFMVLTEATSNGGYGSGGYGEGAYGEGFEHRWTGMARNYSIEGSGGDSFTLSVDGQDYVQATLGMRRVYGSFEDRQIVGSNGILNEVLEEEAPGVDRSLLPDLPARTDVFVSGVKLMDFVGELSDRADAILSSRETSLRFEGPGSLQAAFELTPEDHHALEFKSNDDNLINSVRIDGGQDYDQGDSQETQSGYTRVTDTSRITHQLNHRKSEVDRIELWTRRTGSEDAVIVRLQKNDGGAPIAPGSRKADLTRLKLPYHFIEVDGFTEFILPQHDIPGINPWLIIEAEGSGGQDIGVDANGVPAYKSYYPYPVNVSVPDPTSQTEYGLREGRIKDDSITTFPGAHDLANTHLQRHSEPSETLTVRANSPRAHRLEAGDIVEAHYPTVGADGMYVVSEREQSLSGGFLYNDLSLQSLPVAIASEVTPA